MGMIRTNQKMNGKGTGGGAARLSSAVREPSDSVAGLKGITMCAVESNKSSSSRGAALRIEPVDNWHKAWDDVRKLVSAQGDGKKLRVDKDGWLSARQVLMVAFSGKTPAAYLSFIVSPSKDGCVEARHISNGIDA